MTSKASPPTSQIIPYLEKNGVDNAWRSLIKTHAFKAYPETGKDVFNSPSFRDAEVLSEDFLSQLSIGEIGVLYEFSLAYLNPSSRKASGQYFTPDDAAQWMATLTESFPKTAVILDPCSGVGNLSYHLAAKQQDPEQFILNHLILADLDPLALLIARAIFALRFKTKEENLFLKLENRFVVQDYLEHPHSLAPKLAALKPTHVLMNPPYANVDADKIWQTASTKNLYALFLEQAAATAEGFVSVTPQSYTSGPKFSSVRKLLLNTYRNISIYNFDNMPDCFFRGYKFGSTNTNTKNSVRASVMVANKLNANEQTAYKSTSLLRWTSAQRTKLWNNLPQLLNKTEFSEKLFPKNYAGLENLYHEVETQEDQHDTLRSLLASPHSASDALYSLRVPLTPRYYLTASERLLERSQQHVLRFDSEENFVRAYLYLNSSYAYWWWKLEGDGMMLSSSTLLSTPIPRKALPKDAGELVAALRLSEQQNLVVKINAGKPQQNVKHSKELIRKINKALFTENTAQILETTSRNSDLNL